MVVSPLPKLIWPLNVLFVVAKVAATVAPSTVDPFNQVPLIVPCSV